MILDNDCTHKKINQNRYLCLNGLGTKVGMWKGWRRLSFR
jgi:hypothetical protein